MLSKTGRLRMKRVGRIESGSWNKAQLTKILSTRLLRWLECEVQIKPT